MKNKIYILITALIFTSCVSNTTKTGTTIQTSTVNSNSNLESKVLSQEEEFKKLESENKKLETEIEELKKRIENIEKFYEIN
jgi:cell division protein FtsB